MERKPSKRRSRLQIEWNESSRRVGILSASLPFISGFVFSHGSQIIKWLLEATDKLNSIINNYLFFIFKRFLVAPRNVSKFKLV
jgi:hypothetical protein